MRIFILSTIVLAVLSDIHWGTCPEVTYELESFEAEKYMGRWYEVARSSSIPFEHGECSEANYEILDTGVIRVENTEVINGVRNGIIGTANPTSNPFQFKIDFGGIMAKFFKGDYRVVNTDYTGFAIVYSCSDLYFVRSEWVWILSRTPTVDPVAFQNLKNYANTHLGFPLDSYTYSNQNAGFCKR